jgi:hypothetical protein
VGQVRSAKLATSTAVGFNIQLDDCDTTVATKASVAFSGTAIDSTNTTVLALQTLPPAARPTSAYRSSTAPVRRWRWMAQPSAQQPPERRHQHHSVPGSLLRDCAPLPVPLTLTPPSKCSTSNFFIRQEARRARMARYP